MSRRRASYRRGVFSTFSGGRPVTRPPWRKWPGVLMPAMRRGSPTVIPARKRSLSQLTAVAALPAMVCPWSRGGAATAPAGRAAGGSGSHRGHDDTVPGPVRQPGEARKDAHEAGAGLHDGAAAHGVVRRPGDQGGHPGRGPGPERGPGRDSSLPAPLTRDAKRARHAGAGHEAAARAAVALIAARRGALAAPRGAADAGPAAAARNVHPRAGTGKQPSTAVACRAPRRGAGRTFPARRGSVLSRRSSHPACSASGPAARAATRLRAQKKETNPAWSPSPVFRESLTGLSRAWRAWRPSEG